MSVGDVRVGCDEEQGIEDVHHAAKGIHAHAGKGEILDPVQSPRPDLPAPFQRVDRALAGGLDARLRKEDTTELVGLTRKEEAGSGDEQDPQRRQQPAPVATGAGDQEQKQRGAEAQQTAAGLRQQEGGCRDAGRYQQKDNEQHSATPAQGSAQRAEAKENGGRQGGRQRHHPQENAGYFVGIDAVIPAGNGERPFGQKAGEGTEPRQLGAPLDPQQAEADDAQAGDEVQGNPRPQIPFGAPGRGGDGVVEGDAVKHAGHFGETEGDVEGRVEADQHHQQQEQQGDV